MFAVHVPSAGVGIGAPAQEGLALAPARGVGAEMSVLAVLAVHQQITVTLRVLPVPLLGRFLDARGDDRSSGPRRAAANPVSSARDKKEREIAARNVEREPPHGQIDS